MALEVDGHWAARLRQEAQRRNPGSVRVINADVLRWPLPNRPFRVMGNLAFGSTTDILHQLLDQPAVPLLQADLVVQWEVARKRAAAPPSP